jgi:ABC-type nitrate/sulfonate/bicarbonate transport system substrate-binding protein
MFAQFKQTIPGCISALAIGFISLFGAASWAADQSSFERQQFAQASVPATSSSPAKIVIATGIDPSFAHYVIAVKKGFFEKQGIQAELRSFDDGNVALDSLLTGAADIGGTSELGGVVRIARGGKLYVIASGIQYPDFFGVVGKNSIKTPKDFEGKSVGVPRGSGAHLFLAKYAAFHKVDLDKIKLRFLQAPESVAALSRGDIDAFFLWEPWLSRAVSGVPDTRIIALSSQNHIFQLNTYVYFSQRLVDNDELAKKAIRALIDGAEWTMANRTEAAKIVGETYHLPAADAEKIMAPIMWNIHYSPIFRNYLLEAAEFAKKAGIITEIPNLDPYLRPDLLKSVDPARVKAN